MKLEFSKTNALILGGSCEIGILLGRLMISSGLFPLMTFRSPEGKKKITSALQPFSGQYAMDYLDFAEPASMDAFFSRNIGELHYLVDLIHGDIVQLVASSGSRNICRFYEENVSLRARVLEMISRRMMTQKFGRMVYVSSTAAARPHPGQGFYASSKLASEAIYKNLGLELGGKNITTVVLRPGYIDAGRGRAYAALNRKEILEKIPIKRLLSVDEVAETILFLISDSALGLNATEIVLDGGLCAGK